MVEHSTADREVPSSNLGAPFIRTIDVKSFFVGVLERGRFSREAASYQLCAGVLGDGFDSFRDGVLGQLSGHM